MNDELSLKLAEISLAVLPEGLALEYVAIAALREQDLNARSMTSAMFDQLVANVRGAKVLESVPLLVWQDEQRRIVSGHHRIRAARAAGLTHLLVLTYASLSIAQMHAKQIAHNTIAGTDDPQILKELWDKITEVQAQFESFLDPRLFATPPPAAKFAPVDIDWNARTKEVLIAFLPHQLSVFEDVVARLHLPSTIDRVYLAHSAQFDLYQQAYKAVRAKLNVVAIPTALGLMAELALERLEQMTEAERSERFRVEKETPSLEEGAQD